MALRESRVITINRVAKVVKGGRRFSFTALVVIGDGNGRVGLGYGKAKEVPLAIQKGTEEAKKNLFEVPSPAHDHPPDHRRSPAPVACCMKPAAPGTGVIAGGAARIILEEAGIHDVLCKSLGSSNPINVARATIAGLQSLQRPDEIARRRGLPAEDFVPKGMLGAYETRRSRSAASPTESSRSMVTCSENQITVTQVRSAIGTKPKTRGTLRALGLGRIGKTNTSARPSRDPRHDRPRAAPHRREHRSEANASSTTTHEQQSKEAIEPCASTNSPRHPAPPSRPSASVVASAARAARPPAAVTKGQHARNTVRPRLRRWPDAAQAARPEAEGLQQPVPRRVPGRQPRHARRARGVTRSTPEVLVEPVSSARARS